jgi:hypothetical protein
MYRFKFTPRMLLILLWIFAAPLQASLSNSPDEGVLPKPELDLLPQDVVKIAIDALANNDRPFSDAGIATTFAFASPANKINTGPLQKFAQMIRTPAYGIMVDHVEHEFSEVVLMGDNAYQMVRVLGNSGAEVIFAFRLSQQLDGEFDGMWMTDAVWPVATGDIPEQAF